MSQEQKVYYKKTWFSDRHKSLLDLVFDIVDSDESESLIERSKDKRITLDPGLFGIYMINDLTLLILIFLLSKGYNTLGCKTLYISQNTKYWYYAQLGLFLVIYFIISIPYAETLPQYGIVIPPAWTLMLSIIVWLLSNAMARLGEKFAFYNPFFWPSALTWYGFLGIFLTILYVVNEYYNYYYRTLPDAQITILLEYILVGSYMFVASSVGYIFISTFYQNVILEKESIIDFFFKLDSTNCKDNNRLYKKFDKEIKKNS